MKKNIVDTTKIPCAYLAVSTQNHGERGGPSYFEDLCDCERPGMPEASSEVAFEEYLENTFTGECVSSCGCVGYEPELIKDCQKHGQYLDYCDNCMLEGELAQRAASAVHEDEYQRQIENDRFADDLLEGENAKY